MDMRSISIPYDLKSERLVIRLPRIEDASQAFDAVSESLVELRHWMHWMKMAQTIEGCKTQIQQSLDLFLNHETIPFHIFLKDIEFFVGAAGMYKIDWRARKFEIGYWCRTGYAGNGFVTEATNALTAFAFERLQANRVEIRCDTRNAKSVAVARRCGFLQEAILRHDDLGVDGELRSTYVFSKISPNEFNYYDADGQAGEG